MGWLRLWREISGISKPILSVHPRQHLFRRFLNHAPIGHAPRLFLFIPVRSIAQSAKESWHDWPISERPFTAEAHPGQVPTTLSAISRRPFWKWTTADSGVLSQTPCPPPLDSRTPAVRSRVCSPNPRCPQRAEPAAIYPAVQVPIFLCPLQIAFPVIQPVGTVVHCARDGANVVLIGKFSDLPARPVRDCRQQRPREFLQILRLLLEIRRVWNDLADVVAGFLIVRPSGRVWIRPRPGYRCPSPGCTFPRSFPALKLCRTQTLVRSETSTLMCKLRIKWYSARSMSPRAQWKCWYLTTISVDNFRRAQKGRADQIGDGDFRSWGDSQRLG